MRIASCWLSLFSYLVCFVLIFYMHWSGETCIHFNDSEFFSRKMSSKQLALRTHFLLMLYDAMRSITYFRVMKLYLACAAYQINWLLMRAKCFVVFCVVCRFSQ